MKKTNLALMVGVLAVAILLTGCKVNPTAAPRPTSPNVIRETSEGGTEEIPGVVIPDDVPLPEGIYNLEVNRDQTVITFRIDGGIEPLVAFFAEELALLGWTPMRSPDNVIGAIGTMSRQNDAGDKIAINLQYNQIGDFTTVYITITRISK
jgi:hypothetical protein